MSWRQINEKYVNPARGMMRQGKLNEAEELLLWGYKEKNDGWIAYHLGEVYIKLNQPTSALKYYQLAEKTMPKEEYKQLAREGQKKARKLIKGESVPHSWIYVNSTYIYPARQMADPEKALKLLEKGYQKTDDPWIAFHKGIRLSELAKISEARKNFEIAYNNLPLSQYKALAKQELEALEGLKGKVEKEEVAEERKPTITITEVNGPKEVSPETTSFEIQLIIHNSSSQKQPLIIWFHALWSNGQMGARPTFYAKEGVNTIRIPVPTPLNDGEYYIEIQLLNQEGLLIENQIIQVPFEVKTSGIKKLLKWGKYLGMMFGPRL